MIRINLMAVERGRTARWFGPELGNKVTLACCAIFVAVLAVVVWQSRLAGRETARLDDDLLDVNQELGPKLETDHVALCLRLELAVDDVHRQGER